MTEIEKIYKDLSNIQYGSKIFKGVYKQGHTIFIQVDHQLYSGHLGLIYRDTEEPGCIRVCGTDTYGMDLFVDVDISRFRDELGYTFRTSTLNSILEAYNTLSNLISGKIYGFQKFLKGIGIEQPNIYIQRFAKVGTYNGVDDKILEYVVEANIPKPSGDNFITVVDNFSLTCYNVGNVEVIFKTSTKRMCTDDIGTEWVMNLDKTINFCNIDKYFSEIGLSQSLPSVYSFTEATKEKLQSVYNKFNNKIV